MKESARSRAHLMLYCRRLRCLCRCRYLRKHTPREVSCHGKCENKGRPLPWDAFCPDSAAVLSDDGSADCQAQTGPNGWPRRSPGKSHILYTVELVEDRL